MRLGEFIGNHNLKEQIKAMFVNRKVPHAIILEGQPGIGKKTFAKIIANFAVCSRFNGEPCYECDSCLKTANNMHPDIIFPEKTGVLQAVSVAEVRRIKLDAYVVPNEAPYKAYIFTDVDNMGVQAQNSLLKVLEEPPKNVIFIFTCTNIGHILPTVRSRAQVFKVSTVNDDEAVKFLLEHQSKYDEIAIKEAVQMSCGCIGKAIAILNEEKVKSSIALADKIVDAIADLNDFEIMINFGRALEDKKELKSILDLLYVKVKNAVILDAGGNIALKSEVTARLAKRIEAKRIVKILNLLDKSIQLCNQNVNKELIVTYVCGELHKLLCD